MTYDWKTVSLGSVCGMVKRGIAPKYIENGGVRVINQKCVRNHSVDFSLARRHDQSEKPVKKERLLKVGDVLINSTGVGTLGRVAQIRQPLSEPTTVDTHVTIVRPLENMFVPEFFGYLLVVIEDDIKLAGKGAGGQTELSRTALVENFHVSFPSSKAIQKRIVAILDEAFAGIDQAIANTEKNIANAKELFESAMERVFCETDQKWLDHSLAEVASHDCALSYGIVQPGDEYPGGLPIVRPTDMTKEYIDPSEVKHIDPARAVGYNRTTLKGGDLLLCVRGATGKVAIAPIELRDANVTRGIVPIRFDTDTVAPRFGYYILISQSFQRQIRKKTYGTALMQINIRDLRCLRLQVPVLEEQKVIATRIDMLMTERDQLLSSYQGTLQRWAELKQSLFQKAFSGELTVNVVH